MTRTRKVDQQLSDLNQMLGGSLGYVARGTIPLVIALVVIYAAGGPNVRSVRYIWTAAAVVVATAIALALVSRWRSSSTRDSHAGLQILVESELPKLVSAIQAVASGNLNTTVEFDSTVASGEGPMSVESDSFASMVASLAEAETAFAQMTENLTSVIGRAAEISRDVQDISDSLAQASDESSQAASDVAGAIGSVADGAVSQAAVTNQVATAVKGIEAALETATATVEVLSAASHGAEEKADNGRHQLDEAIAAMDRITSSFGAVAGTVAELGDRSEKVEEIVDLIRSIAEQTNLLALNAAIEAARAGEAGRGFAVVASEVKSLAEESATSAEEIAELVGHIRGSVADARAATDAGREDVSQGAQVIDGAGSAFRDIVDAVASMDSQVSGLVSANADIRDAAGAIGDGVQELLMVAESNSAVAEEVAASSEETAANASEIGGTAQDLAASSRDLAAALRGFTFGDGSLDFGAAISAHQAWKARISNYLKGREQLHAEDVSSHRDCELGTWLYGSGMKTYGHFEEIKSLERDHQQLHVQIKKVIEAHSSSNTDAAQRAYQEMLALSERVVADLSTLQHKV
jgi:methyl-accepting chemotaxis protein